jgi:nucleoporin SEH1
VILASCGFDKRVNIWQEKKEDGKVNWTSRAKIQDFSDSVEDISFCPKVHGLKIAATTLNGKMKIFEPTDYANNINWNCISTKDVSSVGCSSVCWNPSSIDPQTLVVGCHFDAKKNNQQDLIQLYAYIDSKKEYSLICNFQNGHSNSVTDVEWAPQFGRSFHLIASCSIDKSLIIWKLNLKYSYNNEHFDNISAEVENLLRFTNDSPVLNL